MPVTYRIDPDEGILFGTITGSTTAAEMLEAQSRLRADPLFQPHFRILIDLRGVETVDVTVDGVRRLAEKNPFGAGARRAIVADREVVFGLARMFEMMTDHTADETRVFSDMAEARKWLGME